MEYARFGSGSPPPALKLAFWCGDNRLPSAGGVLDQDGQLWTHMQTMLGVYRISHKIANLKGEAIHTLDGGERRAWRWMIDEGLWA